MVKSTVLDFMQDFIKPVIVFCLGKLRVTGI